MKLLKKLNRKKMQQAGQGMTEYMLLIVVVLAAAAVFKKPILEAIGDKMGNLKTEITGFNKDTQ